jgi:hypothetical protein
LAFVAKENVLLAEKRAPVHCPEATAESLVIQSYAIIGIMYVMIVDGEQALHAFEGREQLDALLH